MGLSLNETPPSVAVTQQESLQHIHLGGFSKNFSCLEKSIMKKTLAAVAVLGAFAGSALAADVTLYGVVDAGLMYNHADKDDGKDAVDTFEMKSGIQSGSRFGLKGVEDLGNDMQVGFVLENGFDADTGKLGNNNRLFGREANLFVRGNFGEISFGRVGQLTSGNGTYGIAGNLSPFGTSWSAVKAVEGSTFMVGYSRADNTITYKIPAFAGLNVYAQYSSDMNTLLVDEDNKALTTENKGNSNRYAALGATYKNAGLNLVGVVDWYNWDSSAKGVDVDDGYTVTLGGSYDFEVVKAYLGAQYFDNMLGSLGTKADGNKDSFGLMSAVSDAGIKQAKGYAVTAGVDAPVLGGNALFAVGYSYAEDSTDTPDLKDAEFTRFGVSAGYTYALSKRTNVYGVVAYSQDKLEKIEETDRDPSNYGVAIGLRHKF